jgi:hypothetical protein
VVRAKASYIRRGQSPFAVNAFDDQARQVFGCSADELHAAREGDNGAAVFARALAEAQWRPWLLLKVKTKTTEEYNGEARRCITAVAMSRPDYAAESKALLAAMGIAVAAA